ncbi:helix-turn-helix transcriptional regulator [Clostridium aceticum]|nr:helix-turn-helix transcriptional regulator [Clostridium aceticum]
MRGDTYRVYNKTKKIIKIVQESEPITSQEIAELLKVTRATLRPDLAILTMSGTLDARPKVGYFYSGKPDINLISQEIKGIKVKDIMSIPVVVTEDMSVYNAIVTMFLEDTSSIYVVSDGSLVGVISRKDFLKNAIGTIDINKVPVAMIMTRMPNIATTSPEEDVLVAASKIVEHEVDSLPVVEKVMRHEKQKLKVVGKISKSNMTKLLVELCKE